MTEKRWNQRGKEAVRKSWKQIKTDSKFIPASFSFLYHVALIAVIFGRVGIFELFCTLI